jgi:hypothetical protein
MDAQLAALKADLSVRLHVIIEENWDSESMLLRRAQLAHQLLSNMPHAQVQEVVMEFFESLAMLDMLGLVHKEPVWNAFGFHASRWWSAYQEYIVEERRQRAEQNSPVCFIQFEAFAERLKDREARELKTSRAAIEPGADEINRFLHDELALKPEVGVSPLIGSSLKRHMLPESGHWRALIKEIRTSWTSAYSRRLPRRPN